MFPVDLINLNAGRGANVVYRTQQSFFNRQYLAVTRRDISLNLVIKFPFGTQTEINELIEILVVTAPNQKLEADRGLENDSVESEDDFTSIITGGELYHRYHELRYLHHEACADRLISGEATLSGRCFV